MFYFRTRAIRRRRAIRYFRAYPEDLAAVQAVLAALDLKAKTAKEAAEMLFGRELPDVEWQKMSARWERVWNGII
jgi:hypothetical protein